MPSDRPRRILLVGLAGCLAGCASAGGGGLQLGKADNFGEAYRQTLAAQIINPAPEYDNQVAVSSGAHAAAALERYRTDTVKQPARQTLSNVGSKSGGSSGAQSGSGN